MVEAQLVDIRIYPVKDEPGQRLESIAIGPDGLDGDRRKKAAVHVVSIEDGNRDAELRANLFVSASDSDLIGAVGQELRVGGAVLHVDREPSGCPGVYASVTRPGMVHAGDRVTAQAVRHDGEDG